jgi:hypothetical protein
MLRLSPIRTFSLIVVSGLLSGCGMFPFMGPGAQDAELAHSLGDIMGSADESLSRSTLALRRPPLGLPESLWAQASQWLIPLAEAAGANCYQQALSACSSNERSLTYESCKLGPLVLLGKVTFKFAGGSSCALSVDDDFVRRIPDYTVTGRQGGVLGVTVFDAATAGQKIVRKSASTYSYSITGLRRYFDDPAQERLVDLSFRTTSDMQITGSTRATRRMTGGTLEITNNIDGSVISLSPNALRWSSTCSCPTSGSWVGQIVDAENMTTDFVVTLESCGSAEVKRGDETSSVSLERCVVL